MAKDKIILSYSGGLDTTVIIPWLKENYDYDVVALCIDLGQEADFSLIKERAIKTGAAECYVIDAKKTYIDNYAFFALKAGAIYEDDYLLGTATARPLIAELLAEYAKKLGAVAICHGATGKGNDQVRFELAIKKFNPTIKIIAPWRDAKWTLDSREKEIQYLQEHNISLPVKEGASYSCDDNIWHISHEGLELEDTQNEADYQNMLQEVTLPENVESNGVFVKLEFSKGVPVSLNGMAMDSVALVKTLNSIAAKNGVGIADLVENRFVGMKSRGVYETPAGTVLYAAHRMMEHLCLDKETYHYKQQVALKISELIYEGKWYTPLMAALTSFVNKTQETLTGWVKLKLYKGVVRPISSYSKYSLYNESLASFKTGDLFDHKDAAGFIKLVGLPIEVRARMEESLEEEAQE